MKRLRFSNTTLLGFILLLCAAGMATLLLYGSHKLKKATGRVTHTHEVIQTAREVSIDTNTLLISQQRYILTRNPEFLKSYQDAKRKVTDHIGELESRTRDNPVQSARIQEIRAYIGILTQLLETSFAEDGGTGAGQFSQAVIARIDAMAADIMKVTANLRNEEYRLLDARVQAIEAERDRYVGSLFGGGILCLALLALFNIILLRSQERRAAAERNLREAEERFRLAMEGTNDGLFDWNIRDNGLVISDRYAQMLGYAPGELEASREELIKLIHPDDIGHVREFLVSYLAGGGSEYSNTYRMRHKSGHWLWLNSRGKAVHDGEGRPVRLVGAVTDITHIKAFEERLLEAKQHAEKASQAKTEFLAHMSHEIRTPLTAISGIAEILQGGNQDNLNDRQRQLVKTLASSTEALKDLINDILDFSKIESGEIELARESFALQPLLAQVAGIMAVRAAEKGLDLIVHDDDMRNLSYIGDKVRLRQILMNLVGNAVKFTERGEVIIHAALESHAGMPSPLLRIDVADTGIGIRAEHSELIFDHFKQADSSVNRRFGGTGLGLPISRRLARLMGGDLTVRSEQGKGSVFTILLPLDEAAQDSAETPSPATSDIAGDAHRPHILMAEDYDGNVVMLGYLLDAMSCTYEIARTGAEAVRMAGQKDYDLILMDIQMPEMDGLMAARTIRAQEAAKRPERHTPIIGMTAHASVGDRERCLEAGMDDYLPKPIAEDDFRRKIAALLPRPYEAGLAS